MKLLQVDPHSKRLVPIIVAGGELQNFSLYFFVAVWILKPSKGRKNNFTKIF